MENSICQICGKPVQYERYGFTKKDIIGQEMRNGFCYECSFWIEKVKLHTNRTFIIESNGKLTRFEGGVIDRRKYNSGFGLGCGGHTWYIHYLTTNQDRPYRIFNNCFCQGDVPEYLQGREGFELLNKNAEVLTDKQYYKWLQTWIEKNKLETGSIVLGYNSNGLTGIYLYNSSKKLFYYFDSKEKRFDEKSYYQIIDPLKVSSLQKENILGIPLDEKNKVILEKEYTEEEKKRLFNPYRSSLL